MTTLSDIAGHAYAPGHAPLWWEALVRELAAFGLTPMLAGLLLLGFALFVVTTRRSLRARPAPEFTALEHAAQRAAEHAACREAERETLRELRIRRSLGGGGAA